MSLTATMIGRRLQSVTESTRVLSTDFVEPLVTKFRRSRARGDGRQLLAVEWLTYIAAPIAAYGQPLAEQLQYFGLSRTQHRPTTGSCAPAPSQR